MDLSAILILLAQQYPDTTVSAELVSLVGLAGYVLTHALAKVPVPTEPGLWMTTYKLWEKLAGAWGNQKGSVVPPIATVEKK